MQVTDIFCTPFRRVWVIVSLMPLLCLVIGCGGGGIVPVPSGTNFTISGTIAGGPQATVALSGAASATTIADSMGNYSFANLANGSYVVTPTASNCFGVVPPLQQTVHLNGANVSGINFTGTDPKLQFCDDFTGSTLSSNWYAMNRFGDVGNGEVQCYVPPQDVVAGGYLTITTALQNVTCDTNSKPSSYSSGMATWSSFHFTYGTIEFRAKMTGGQGTWPAIWLLGAQCEPSNAFWSANQGTCNWPAPGSDEIDITEILQSNHSTVNQQIHTVADANGQPKYNDGCQPSTSFDTSADFHIYRLVWVAGSLNWYIDPATNAAPTCTVSASYVPDTPMFLIVNTAVGGSGGTVNNSTLPQTMQVDYVKVTGP